MRNSLKTVIAGCVLVVLSLISTQAMANSIEFAVSKYTLSELATGKHNSEVVNKSGMTGQEVLSMLNYYTMETEKVSIYDFLKLSYERPITESHYNTESVAGGLRVYRDRKPEGHKRVYGGIEIKVECCNPVSSDKKKLLNLINNYKNTPAALPPVTQIGDGGNQQKDSCSDCSKKCDDCEDIDSSIAKNHRRMKSEIDNVRELKKALRQDDLDAIDNAKKAAEKMGYSMSNNTCWVLPLCLFLILLLLFLLLWFLLNRKNHSSQHSKTESIEDKEKK